MAKQTFINKARGNVVHIGRGVFSRFSNSAFLVCGLGRCGTSLMCSTIKYRNLFVAKETNFVIDSRKVINLTPGIVYKSHGFPPKEISPYVKVLYMFGNPYNAALSAYYNLVHTDHYRHTGVEKVEEPEEIFYRDVYDMEKNFDAWYQPQGFTFLSLRYESIYDPEVRDIVSQYLGIDLKLPRKKERCSNHESHPMKAHLEETYGALSKKVEGARDVKLWTPEGLTKDADGAKR